MLMNMFSMFDSNIMKTPINMMMMMIMVTMLSNSKTMWMKNNKNKNLLNKMNKTMLKNQNNKTMMELFVPLTLLVTTMNVSNIIPNIMSMSSMMTFNLAMTLTLWMNMMMMSIKNNKVMMLNLSPKNTPMGMMWIINIIELNSMVFQIISLTMRLSINMMLGHIIMMLINKCMLMTIYLTIEMMIIMIQSYIYITLNMLNFNSLN